MSFVLYCLLCKALVARMLSNKIKIDIGVCKYPKKVKGILYISRFFFCQIVADNSFYNIGN